MEWNFVRPFGICHAKITVILLTSKVEKLDVVLGLEIGVDDSKTKPVNPIELHARLKAGRRIIEMHRVLTVQNTVTTDTLTELRSIHAAFDQDRQQARKTQQALVPDWQRNFGASRVSFLLQPCGHVGGDLVRVLNSDLDHLGFYCTSPALMVAQVLGYLNNTFLDYNIAMRRRIGGVFDLWPLEEVAQQLN